MQCICNVYAMYMQCILPEGILTISEPYSIFQFFNYSFSVEKISEKLSIYYESRFRIPCRSRAMVLNSVLFFYIGNDNQGQEFDSLIPMENMLQKEKKTVLLPYKTSYSIPRFPDYPPPKRRKPRHSQKCRT